MEAETSKAQQLVEQAGEKLLAYLDGTEQFVSDQAPRLANEIVTFGIWSNLLWAVVCFLIFGLCVYFVYWTFSKRVIDYAIKNSLEPAYGIHILTAIPIVLSFLIGVYSVTTALQAAIAPRLYILEQVGRLF